VLDSQPHRSGADTSSPYYQDGYHYALYSQTQQDFGEATITSAGQGKTWAVIAPGFCAQLPGLELLGLPAPRSR
jgi:hypothetical protein